MSYVQVTNSHGYFHKGQVLEVADIISYVGRPRSVQYLVIKCGNTIPKESTKWVYSHDGR